MSDNTEKIQVSENFAEKAQSVASAFGGIGQSPLSDAPKGSLLDSISVPEKTDKTEVSTEQTPNVPNATAPDTQGEQQTQKVEKPGDDQQKPTNTEEVDDFEFDSPIFGGKTKVVEAKKEEEGGKKAEEIQGIEGLEKYAKEYGFEDSKKLITELPELVKSKKQLEDVSKTVKSYEAVFESIPNELFVAIEKFAKGEDWRSVISKTEPIDFSVEYGKQNVQKLVDNYYPGKITQEEWEEYQDKNGDESVKEKVNNYLSFVQEKYNLDQEKFKNHKSQYEQKAAQTIQARKESLEKSRATVFEAFKSSGLKLDEKYVSSLDNTLASDQAILSIFKNEDGTLKQDAHQKLAMANDGFGLVTQYQKAIERKMVSMAREEILDRAGSQQAIKKTGDAPQPGIDEMRDKVRKKVDSMLPS